MWKRPNTVKPKMSARFAPILSCMMALCFLSTHVNTGAKKPTVIARTKRIFTNVMAKSTHIFITLVQRPDQGLPFIDWIIFA